MKHYTGNDFSIANSGFEVRLAYTGFLLLTLIGYASFGLMARTHVGSGLSDIVAHYRGSETEEVFPVTVGQLIEGLHFHAFVMALVLLVLTYVVVATSIPRSLKSGVIILAYTSALAKLAAPWLIKFVSGGFAYLVIASWAGMWIAALVMILVPLWEMWWVGPEKPSR